VATDETPDIGDDGDPRPAHGRPFVPPGFEPPTPPTHADLWLEPLDGQHNDADYDAWTSSMEHIRATPGFQRWPWPHPMTREDNLVDLQRHARHFERRVGFTYTVRDTRDGDVVGCVYIYPSDDPAADAAVRSWVRVSHAGLDAELAALVAGWLRDEWPFAAVAYR
jgi:hypothetical protein